MGKQSCIRYSVDEKYRIRYGKDLNGKLKNTLVTKRIGDMVYFGISRCNLEAGERFFKRKGCDRARERLEWAITQDDADPRAFRLFCASPGWMQDSVLAVSADLSCGLVHVNNVSSLIQFFEEIDFYCWIQDQERLRAEKCLTDV